MKENVGDLYSFDVYKLLYLIFVRPAAKLNSSFVKYGVPTIPIYGHIDNENYQSFRFEFSVESSRFRRSE